MGWVVAVVVSAALAVLQAHAAERVPSVFGVDAPELARPGQFAVGVRTLFLVERDQPDLLAMIRPAERFRNTIVN